MFVVKLTLYSRTTHHTISLSYRAYTYPNDLITSNDGAFSFPFSSWPLRLCVFAERKGVQLKTNDLFWTSGTMNAQRSTLIYIPWSCLANIEIDSRRIIRCVAFIRWYLHCNGRAHASFEFDGFLNHNRSHGSSKIRKRKERLKRSQVCLESMLGVKE